MTATHLDCTPATVAEALAEAESLCAKRGGELTPLRKRVLRLLLESDRPTKAYELLKILKDTGQAKPPTVYRSLDFLREAGLVHRIESLQAFVPCRHWAHGHAVVFLICDNCGAVAELDAPESLWKLTQEASAVRFKTRQAIIEVRGACTACG